MNTKRQKRLRVKKPCVISNMCDVTNSLMSFQNENLAAMDYLRLQRYPFTLVTRKKDPKQRVQKDLFRMFTEMLDSLKHHDVHDTLLE